MSTKSNTRKKSTPRLSKKARQNAMIEQLEKTLGVVTHACKRVGIDRSTHYDWYNKDESYRNRVDDIAEIALDFAESQLHLQMRSGNTSATIFYLKTKGKKRGYIERTEHDFGFDENGDFKGFDFLRKAVEAKKEKDGL